MGVDHYENFPVASILVPARLRAAVREIYRFARTADDIADEGDAPAHERLAALAALRADLDRIEAGRYPAGGPWWPLAQAIDRHRLPVERLRELLVAFEQDARGTRYADDAQLLDYCRFSANPVGRLVLALYGREEAQFLRWSDAICTGLQLVNFWQDVARDQARGRVYIPAATFARYGVDPAQLAAARVDAAWTRLMLDRTQFARARLLEGRPLARAIGGRLGLELRLVVEGGLRVAERIDAAGGDVFERRPVLGRADWLRLCARAALTP
jgi:squalene synthase HpnC